MTTRDLPLRDDFIANNIIVIDTCNICLEPFNTEHLPARLSGTNSCYHVFGSTCLKKWLTSENDNANKCPTCRTLLYNMDNDEYNDYDDYSDDANYDDDDNYNHDDGYNQYQGVANNATQAMSATLYQPDQQYRQNPENQQDDVTVTTMWDIDDLDTAYALLDAIVDCLGGPENCTSEHIRASVQEAIQEVAQRMDVIIIVEEFMWLDIITAVRKLLAEWRVQRRFPSLIVRLQIVGSELQWG